MEQSLKNSATSIDLLEESLSNPLAISFQTSTSSGYPLAVTVAKQAAQYAEAALTPKKMVHFSVFSSEPVQVARALAVVKYVGHLKGTRVYASGRQIDSLGGISGVLDCYLAALACDDWRAHCYKVIGERDGLRLPPTVIVETAIENSGKEVAAATRRATEYLIPCRYVAHRAGYGMERINFSHPAGIAAQIQSLGIDAGCAWCPNFNAADHRPV